jgi:hypothetical protein
VSKCTAIAIAVNFGLPKALMNEMFGGRMPSVDQPTFGFAGSKVLIRPYKIMGVITVSETSLVTTRTHDMVFFYVD